MSANRPILLGAVAVAVLSAAISLTVLSRCFEGGITHEFCHYSEIGRNILEGKGYHTAMVTPPTLAFIDERGLAFDAHTMAPVFDRFPLQAYLTAFFELLLGKNDAALAALSVFLLALAAAATFWLGCRLASPAEAAVAAIFFALDPSFQRGFVLWGMVDFGFCIMTWLSCAAVCRVLIPGKTRAAWVFAGALTGLAWLSRFNMIIWLPFFYIILWTLGPKDRAARLGLFTTALLAVTSPGWIYSLRWFGSITPPSAAWHLAEHVVQDPPPWLTYKVFTPGQSIIGHFPALLAKIRLHLSWHLRDMPTLWQMNLVFPFALLGFWETQKRPDEARRLFRLMGAMLIFQVLIFSAMRYEILSANVKGRYFLWFAPAAFLLASRGASETGRLLGSKRLGLAAFSLANALFFGKILLSPQGGTIHPAGLSPRDWPEITAASEAAGEDLLVSNLPAQAAWYTRHFAVTLPADPEEISAMGGRRRIGAVLISRLAPGELGNTPLWQDLLTQPGALARFCAAKGLVIQKDFGTAVLLRAR